MIPSGLYATRRHSQQIGFFYLCKILVAFKLKFKNTHTKKNLFTLLAHSSSICVDFFVCMKVLSCTALFQRQRRAHEGHKLH